MPDSAGSAASLHAGLVIGNRFQLVRPLGRGGMGSVWVAWHTTLRIEVAIKFIDTPFGVRPDLLSRFAQEAQTAARIQSPHVVRILDYGSDEWQRPYIAMELLQGEPLSDKLEREPFLPPAEVAEIVTQSCRGLAKAHAAGVVHRDLKPENLFLCAEEDGTLVKIVDFGIARTASPLEDAQHRTGTGQLLGTPHYMSPEQALGRTDIDLRSDLYSLAVVAYRCLTGHLPFELDALGALIVAISTMDPPPPSSRRAGLPGTADAWFARALSRDRAARFGSARELAETFAAALGAPARAPLPSAPLVEPAPAARSGSTFSGSAATFSEAPIELPTHRHGPLFAAVAVGVAGVIGVLWAVSGSASAPPPVVGSAAPPGSALPPTTQMATGTPGGGAPPSSPGASETPTVTPAAAAPPTGAPAVAPSAGPPGEPAPGPAAQVAAKPGVAAAPTGASAPRPPPPRVAPAAPGPAPKRPAPRPATPTPAPPAPKDDYGL